MKTTAFLAALTLLASTALAQTPTPAAAAPSVTSTPSSGDADCQCEVAVCVAAWPQSCYCQNDSKKQCHEKCGGAEPQLQECPPLSSSGALTLGA